MNIADADSEKSHDYVSPDASAPEEITSRYEWAPITPARPRIYPAHAENGRHTTGTSEFTLKLRPENLGVMLRRKLDYSYPNQRAEVSIADASNPADPGAKPDFKPAGIWYLAGSNTCVYSNPKGELDPAEHTVRTSNRRFRDDEFLIPRDLTQGRSAIRVQIKFTPSQSTPLPRPSPPAPRLERDPLPRLLLHHPRIPLTTPPRSVSSVSSVALTIHTARPTHINPVKPQPPPQLKKTTAAACNFCISFRQESCLPQGRKS